MADHTENTVPKKKGKGTSIVVWVLMAMLVAGLGGFGITNFGGGLTAIGTVGDREITVNDYARGLQQELNALSQQVGEQIGFAQAQQLGIDRQVLETLISRTALDAEADRLGLSVGDQTVATAITAMPAFQGAAGTFDRDLYAMTLDRNNLSQPDFETSIRDDEARTILQGAVLGGFVAPAPVTEALVAFVGERRGFSMLRLGEADLPTPLPDPTEAELVAFHETNIDRFTRPEARRITYAALLPETLAPTMQVDEAALRALYDSRIEEFVQPEKRLVERLVYPDAAAAAAAKARLDAGESFETLVAERGLSLDDIDLGDVGREDLGAAADAVFALAEPGVVGPFESDLGPALFRMNAVLAAQETTFEEARETLAAELRTEAARREIADRIDAIDDLLASGATLEELGADQGMTVSTLDYAASAPGDEPVAGYPEFRAAAEALAEGDFPEAIPLADGGLVALRLDEIVPPAPIAFDEARPAVTEGWRAEALARALCDRAIEIKAAKEAGAALATFGILDVTPSIAREGFVEEAPADLVPGLFEMDAGGVRVVEGPGFAAVVQLDSITPAEASGEDAAALREALSAQIEQALAQDAFAAFLTALQSELGIQLDQAAINAVHTQLN